ncbi:MAG: hypothetical protein WCH34_11530, partial [Bacteroidota bacterium]
MLIPIYLLLKAIFNQHMTALRKAILDQAKDTTVMYATKGQMKEALSTVIYNCSSKAYLQAFTLENFELTQLLDKSESYISDEDYEDAITLSKEQYNVMKDHEGILTILEPEDFDAMLLAISNLENYKEVPEQASEHKKSSGTDAIDPCLDLLDVDKKNLGKFVEQFFPAYYSDFELICKVGRPEGIRHISMIVSMRDSVGDFKMKDVICTLTNGAETHVKKSTKNGTVRFLGLPNSLWNITLEYQGYASVEEENLVTEEGTITKFDVVMVKNALNPPTTGSVLITPINKDTNLLMPGLCLTVPSVSRTLNANDDGQIYGDGFAVGS